MANRRSLSKSISTSQKVNQLLPAKLKELAEFGQVLYTWLIPHCDDWGRITGDPFSMKMTVMPANHRPLKDFEKALTAMVEVGLLKSYEADGIGVLEVVNWERYQTGLHKRTASHFGEPSGNFREVPGNSPLREGKGREGKGREGKDPAPGTDPALNPPTDPPPNSIPSELQGLELYETDERLIKEWPSLLPTWRDTYPGIDVFAEVKKAHVWEVTHPKNRKRNRPAFLNSWFKKAQTDHDERAVASQTASSGSNHEWY